MRRKLGEIFEGRANVTRSLPEFVEVLDPSDRQGHGAAIRRARLGVDSEETMAIGDSWNDAPLLEAAGFAVAMGSSPPELRAIADAVVADVAHDGVAEAIEKYVLACGNEGAAAPALAGARIRPFWMPIRSAPRSCWDRSPWRRRGPASIPNQVAVSGNHRVTRKRKSWRRGDKSAHEHLVAEYRRDGTTDRSDSLYRNGHVHRALPASIRIVVVERVPFAVLRSGDAAAVVDRSLRVLSRQRRRSATRYVIEPGTKFFARRVRADAPCD